MDPDANLKEQLQLASKIIWQLENDKGVAGDESYRLAELVLALHDWICMGGHLPPAWKEGQAR